MYPADRSAIVSEARELLGDKVAAFVERRLRPAVALIPDPEAPSRSRFGGLPHLAPGEAWPTYNWPGRFVGQIDFAELPASMHEALPLPSAGLLRLFVPATDVDQDEFFWGDPGYVKTLFAASEPVLQAEWPEKLPDYARSTGCGLRLEAVWDLPPHSVLVDDWPFEDGWNDDYSSFVERLRPTEHLFGYTDFTSLGYDPCPTGSIPFLTLSSLEDFGWCWHDGDYLQVFVASEALERGEFGDLSSDAG